MENITAIATATLILLEKCLACPQSIIGIIFLCLTLTWFMKFYELSSYCSYLLQTLLLLLFTTFKVWVTKNNNECARTKIPITPKNLHNENKLFIGELGMVMEKIGISCDPDGLEEIETLFDVNEPSFEELRAAFDLFDENQDGFIDTEELVKLLCSLGFKEVSEVNCRKMIEVFDENGDGRIEFDEFLKVVEQSFD